MRILDGLIATIARGGAPIGAKITWVLISMMPAVVAIVAGYLYSPGWKPATQHAILAIRRFFASLF